MLSGKDPLKIADVRWHPTAYDDDMNEWMAQQYHKNGKLPSGEERLDYFQELDTKKLRESFERTGQHTQAQTDKALQVDLDAIRQMYDATNKKDFMSLNPQEIAAAVNDLQRRRTRSENPATQADLRQRYPQEADDMGTPPTTDSRHLSVEGMGPVLGRLLSTEVGFVDGSAGWAIELQSLLNQNNPNARHSLDPYVKAKEMLHKEYPGAFATGSIAGMLASGYLYGAPAKAEKAASTALRKTAAKEATAAQRTAAQALRESDLAGNPLTKAIEKAKAKVADDVLKGYTGGAGEMSKIPWDSWQNYEKVITNGQEYAKVGDRLYSRHAVNRTQPSGNRFGPNIYLGLYGEDYGRSVAPQFVEDVIHSVKPFIQDNGNLVYISGTVKVVTNQQGSVITIVTYVK